MTSSTSEQSLSAAKKRATADRTVTKDVITSLMSTIQGRRWVWMELTYAQIWAPGDSLEPYRMAYEKGSRNAGLRLLDAVSRYTPTMYIRMTQENTSVQLEEEPVDDGHDNPSGE